MSRLSLSLIILAVAASQSCVTREGNATPAITFGGPRPLNVVLNQFIETAEASHPLVIALPVSENFNSIGTSAGAAVPTDWKVDKQDGSIRTVGSYSTATNVVTQSGGANMSSSASNGIYNFGAGVDASGADRAIGFLASGTATKSGNLYVKITNSTGSAASGLRISYDVGKYRNGSNAAGFSIQLYYSTDGSAWTSAGANFLTSFAVDVNNNGYETAPGTTVSVTQQELVSSIPNSGVMYLAWNYSVTSGSSVSNAQALAIDNVIIEPITGQTATIAGKVLSSGGRGVTNARVSITGGNLAEPIVVFTRRAGSFEVAGLATQKTYQVAVTMPRYSFSPSTRSVELQTNNMNVNFTASP